MKGATPSGPRAFVSIRASASTSACPAHRQPAEALHHRVREPGRKVLRADPDRDREQDPGRDER